MLSIFRVTFFPSGEPTTISLTLKCGRKNTLKRAAMRSAYAQSVVCCLLSAVCCLLLSVVCCQRGSELPTRVVADKAEDSAAWQWQVSEVKAGRY